MQRLTGYADTQAVLDALQGEKPLWHAHPRAGYLKGQDTRRLETDTAYGELEMVHPTARPPTISTGSLKAVPLRKNLMRLTAPTPA